MSFTPDTNAIPVSGRCQWPFNTQTIASKTQIQTIRLVRVAATNNRFLLLNNTAASISFQMSFKVSFAGTWAMVTSGGSQSITIPAYGSLQSDVFAASLAAGAIVYTRTYHDVSTSTTLSSGYYGTGYKPEAVSFTSGSGYSFTECMLDGMSAPRLLENGTTFEADANGTLPIVQKYYGQNIFSPYGVIGTPVTPTRLVTFLGDSKTQATGPDASGQQGVQWGNIGMGFGTGAPYQNLAVSADAFNGFLANSTSGALRRELLVFGGDYVNAYGANSLTNGSDPAASTTAELNDIQSAIALLPTGSRWYQCTVDPRTTLNSGASWATVTDSQQTPAGNGNNGVATANYFNNLIKTAKPAYMAAVIDIAAPVTSAAGYWLPDMTGDGVHQNNNGNAAKASAFAATQPFSPPDTTAPATPTNLTAKAGDTLAYLTWTNPTDSDYAATKLRRGSTVIYTGTNTSYLDTGLANGTQYGYTVSATDSQGNESQASAVVIATPISLEYIRDSIARGNGLNGIA